MKEDGKNMFLDEINSVLKEQKLTEADLNKRFSSRDSVLAQMKMDLEKVQMVTHNIQSDHAEQSEKLVGVFETLNSLKSSGKMKSMMGLTICQPLVSETAETKKKMNLVGSRPGNVNTKGFVSSQKKKELSSSSLDVPDESMSPLSFSTIEGIEQRIQQSVIAFLKQESQQSGNGNMGAMAKQAELLKDFRDMAFSTKERTDALQKQVGSLRNDFTEFETATALKIIHIEEKMSGEVSEENLSPQQVDGYTKAWLPSESSKEHEMSMASTSLHQSDLNRIKDELTGKSRIDAVYEEMSGKMKDLEDRLKSINQQRDEFLEEISQMKKEIESIDESLGNKTEFHHLIEVGRKIDFLTKDVESLRELKEEKSRSETFSSRLQRLETEVSNFSMMSTIETQNLPPKIEARKSFNSSDSIKVVNDKIQEAISSVRGDLERQIITNVDSLRNEQNVFNTKISDEIRQLFLAKDVVEKDQCSVKSQMAKLESIISHKADKLDLDYEACPPFKDIIPETLTGQAEIVSAVSLISKELEILREKKADRSIVRLALDAKGDNVVLNEKANRSYCEALFEQATQIAEKAVTVANEAKKMSSSRSESGVDIRQYLAEMTEVRLLLDTKANKEDVRATTPQSQHSTINDYLTSVRSGSQTSKSLERSQLPLYPPAASTSRPLSSSGQRKKERPPSRQSVSIDVPSQVKKYLPQDEDTTTAASNVNIYFPTIPSFSNNSPRETPSPKMKQ
eukprot:TRINITY_DN25676_c0_g1_i1.p1 TRINITY_DN25676_c0_g1~~TRINITY_DN25676_c0_g1_i1.p1  ORF type:complete len:851 (-),score=224.92 TRINITY_DN25676_c0_g1_i1:23-2233(-)